MRNLLNISALLCAVALATGCSNEEMMENGASATDLTLIATTGADTRTTIGENYKVNWTTDDSFYAFGGAVSGQEKVYKATAKFTLNGVPASGATEGTFKGQLTGSKSYLQYAVYPLSAYDTKTMTVAFPDAYTYSANSNAPMFGTVSADKKKVNFGQLLSGMMRIELDGLAENTTGSLKLEAENIAGSAELKIDASGKAELAAITGGAGAMTVSFTKQDDADALVLDIPIPAGTYENGIAVTLQIGDASTQIYQTTDNFVVATGTIKEMPGISNIEIGAGTDGLTFSKVMENVEEANKALEKDEKNIAINTVTTGQTISIPSTSTADAPVTLNITDATATNFTVQGTNGGSGMSLKINIPKGTSGELTVTDIEHVEVSGNWKVINSSTGDNTLVVQAGAVIGELIVNDGNIKIEEGGVVKKLTLNADVTINNLLEVPAGQTMEVNLGTHKLTFTGGDFGHIYGELMLKGTSNEARGQILDQSKGLCLSADNAKLTMENVDYTCTGYNGNSSGIFIYKLVSNTSALVKNSTMKCGYYCINTNGTAPVGENNKITLESSEFTAAETALMINNNATVTATNCKFTGGWQGAFLRGGTFSFGACDFNLDVVESYSGKNTTAAGAEKWGDGNKAPSAAITAGNRYDGDSYDHKTTLALTNGCSFTVKENGKTSSNYPAIYLDAKAGVKTQGVTFTYDESCKTAVETAGVLVVNNTTGEVTVNGTASGGGAPE